MTTLTPAQLAAYIDHTLLRAEATADDIIRLAEDANQLGVKAACVSPTRVGLLASRLDSPLACSVVGFPSGAHHPAVVAEETRRAVANGAAEIDMVVNLGAVKDGDYTSVRAGVDAVRAATGPGVVLKVILETAALTRKEFYTCCAVALDAGADYVKTSTGMHPAGGATPDAVKYLAWAVHPYGMKVKASGGIRTLADALAMIDAGADRIGCSATGAILGELQTQAA